MDSNGRRKAPSEAAAKEQDNLETETQFRADVRRQYDPDGNRISKSARGHQSFHDGPRYMQAPKQMQVLPPQHEPIYLSHQPAQQQSKSGLRAQSKVGFLNRLRQSSDTDVAEVFPYAASGDLRQESLISHLQYLRDNQVQISNILNNEIRNLDCRSRLNKAALLSMMAKQSGVRAAKLIGLNDCHSITAHGTSQALLYQCQKVTTDVGAKKTKCGMEPFVLNSLSLDGCPFVPRLHGGLFTTIGDQIMEWKEDAHDWQKAKQTISISHDHLAAMFKMEADSTAMQSLANRHEPSDRSYFDLLGELSAIMENSGSLSLIDTMTHAQRQDSEQTNTVAGQAKLFRTDPSIINYFCDGTVTNVVYPEAMPIMSARLPEALDNFDFSSTTFRQYRGHLDLDPNINYTERYYHLLQYARPAHVLRRSQQLVKAMASNTYLLPCLIIQPRETMVPEWHDLCSEFFEHSTEF
ncbi:hypothetical protein RvY_17210 [Ramazzottius varieornatus]|uniref:Uncharacterized protein n=1 Tax=Ramazzottius varieornatus TaxID=947166 RepID=A0A1D1W1S8_RAMVA|nr:hypothetical protein RvY_17210 [Ramazzottius varieornatus]